MGVGFCDVPFGLSILFPHHLATILLARKSWLGLLVAIVNSLIVCAIGLLRSKLGFIPASLFCICAYAFNMRPWLKESIIDPELNICNKDRTSGRNTVRADLTLMALARESNRYLLTQLIAKATRKLHRPKTRLQDTMNDAFERFGCWNTPDLIDYALRLDGINAGGHVFHATALNEHFLSLVGGDAAAF